MPMSAIYYLSDAMAVWIIVQAIMGKTFYRGGTGCRRENPRAFWCFIGLESLIVVPMICYQFHLDVIAIALFLVLATLLFGCFLYALWLLLDIIIHPKAIREKIRLRHAENPKEFWRVLFFGR